MVRMPADDRTRQRGRPRKSDATGYTVQALDRGLTVLSAIGEGDGPTAADLVESTGLPASTVHRLLASLQGHGYIWQEEHTARWRVALRCFLIGQAFARTRRLETLGRDAMNDLRRETGETVIIAATEGYSVTVVASAPAPTALRVVLDNGDPLAPHATAVGKVLLAHDMTLASAVFGRDLPRLTDATITNEDDLVHVLETVRQRGWALDDGESSDEVRAVAAPILDHAGACVASLGVIGPAARLAPPLVPRVARLTSEAALRISEAIGWQVPERTQRATA